MTELPEQSVMFEYLYEPIRQMIMVEAIIKDNEVISGEAWLMIDGKPVGPDIFLDLDDACFYRSCGRILGGGEYITVKDDIEAKALEEL